MLHNRNVMCSYANRTRLIAAAIVVACTVAPARAQQPAAPDWMRSLDELLNLEVTSVAKKEQRLRDTAAAVFVLTRSDIRRSGLTTVPDLLRLVPGVHVAQLDGNKWAVTIRGFNSRWANKLLVMVDGRSIYTSLFSGVYWDAIAVPLDEIERIEVVRGPGGSIWGANAVNGIVNIITRGPSEGRETTVTGGYGSLDRGANVGHAGPLGSTSSYRVFGTVSGRDRLGVGHDAWVQRSGGFSLESALSRVDGLRVDISALDSTTDSTVDQVTRLVPFTSQPLKLSTDTGNVLVSGRWTRELARSGHLQVASSFEFVRRLDAMLDHEMGITDVVLEHRLGARGRHDLGWGVAYRRSSDTTLGSLNYRLDEPQHIQNLFSAFVQDEIAVGKRFRVTFGTKIEQHAHHDDWAVQPTARVHWGLSGGNSIWAAASRAVHTPSRTEHSMRTEFDSFPGPNGVPIVLAFVGDPEYQDEWVTSFEAGYRFTLGSSVSADVVGYYNRYNGSTTFEPRPPSLEFEDGAPYVLAPLQFSNLLDATTGGLELSATFAARPWWQINGAYTLFAIDPRVDASSQDQWASGYDGNAPRHQGHLRSTISLGRSVDVSGTLLMVDRLRSLNVSGYRRVDARIGWQVSSGVELSMFGENLFDARHVEFGGVDANVEPNEVGRSVQTRLTWRF